MEVGVPADEMVRSGPPDDLGVLDAVDQVGEVLITRIDVYVYRAPIDKPVLTSFGAMLDRPAVFVRIKDADGANGWGEIFANWPAAGAEHRANLLMKDIADLVLDEPFAAPGDLFETLTRLTHTRVIQCGEWGPFRQVIAGLDIALWDLFARKAGKPLAKFLNTNAREHIPVYASGIPISSSDSMIAEARERKIRAFKVKVGFDKASEVAQLKSLVSGLGDEEQLFADANQAWDLEEAFAFIKLIDQTHFGWLEEPIAADAPLGDWKALAEVSHIPLAGGENIAGLDAFDKILSENILRIIQPDVVKWGGITGCWQVARNAMEQGHRYCPHYLGGGLGLVASAHLLAAVGGDGLLEVDVNPNPLRDQFEPVSAALSNGDWQISAQPGLGIDHLPPDLASMQTLTATRTI